MTRCVCGYYVWIGSVKNIPVCASVVALRVNAATSSQVRLDSMQQCHLKSVRIQLFPLKLVDLYTCTRTVGVKKVSVLIIQNGSYFPFHLAMFRSVPFRFV